MRAFLQLSTAVAISALTLCLAPPGFANDSSFGGAGGTVAPVQEDRVRMASEHIKMRLVPKKDEPGDKSVYDSEWHVDARYVFENTTDEKVELTVGFPELGCAADSPCEGSDYSIRNFRTRVDGDEVDHRIEEIDDVEGADDWIETLGRVYLFDVTFEPGATVEIVHHFEHTPSSSVDGYQANYLTRTGKFWKGTIGEATFEVRVPRRHYYLAFPKEYELVEREHSERIDGDWRYVFKTRDWTPEDNFHVHFGNFVEGPGPRCARIPDIDRAYDEAVQKMSCKDEGVRCTKSGKKLNKAARKVALTNAGEELLAFARDSGDAGDRSDEELLRICRNTPYALHGYPFEDEKLRSLFYPDAFQTHCQYCGPDEKGEYPDRWTRAFHAPNPDFTTELMSQTEMKYIRALKLVEKKRKADED
jgi:hypothetical protein